MHDGWHTRQRTYPRRALYVALCGILGASGCTSRTGQSQASAPKAQSTAPTAMAPSVATDAATSAAAQAHAQPDAGPKEPLVAASEALPVDAAHSTSIGNPNNGRLEHAAALPLSGNGFRFNSRRDSGARFATGEVIAAIVRGAQRVAAQFPGSELVVNDLSLEEGGPIAHHGSHRAGRDADILFYLRDDAGNFTPSVGAPLDRDGVGYDFKELSEPGDDLRVHFDAERTWLFVAALLEDPHATVQRIFVVEHLRRALLEAGERAHAKPETIALFAEITCQPSYPHDDHLHVRWFCSFEDLERGCEDLPPLYPWREKALAESGVTPVPAKGLSARAPSKITTQAEANRAVHRAKPHKDVLAFLARRKAWEKQPHPGRQYCR